MVTGEDIEHASEVAKEIARKETGTAIIKKDKADNPKHIIQGTGHGAIPSHWDNVLVMI